MEYCARGGLIDFMITSCRRGLSQVTVTTPRLEGRKCFDIDIGIRLTIQALEFGSTAPIRPAATLAAEGRLIEDDIQKHTTLQYRSPEKASSASSHHNNILTSAYAATPNSPSKPKALRTGGLAETSSLQPPSKVPEEAPTIIAQDDVEAWETSFCKRYLSLSESRQRLIEVRS